MGPHFDHDHPGHNNTARMTKVRRTGPTDVTLVEKKDISTENAQDKVAAATQTTSDGRRRGGTAQRDPLSHRMGK